MKECCFCRLWTFLVARNTVTDTRISWRKRQFSFTMVAKQFCKIFSSQSYKRSHPLPWLSLHFEKQMSASCCSLVFNANALGKWRILLQQQEQTSNTSPRDNSRTNLYFASCRINWGGANHPHLSPPSSTRVTFAHNSVLCSDICNLLRVISLCWIFWLGDWRGLSVSGGGGLILQSTPGSVWPVLLGSLLGQGGDCHFRFGWAKKETCSLVLVALRCYLLLLLFFFCPQTQTQKIKTLLVGAQTDHHSLE